MQGDYFRWINLIKWHLSYCIAWDRGKEKPLCQWLMQIKCLFFFFLSFRRKLQPFPQALPEQIKSMLELPILSFRGSVCASLECLELGGVCSAAVALWGPRCCHGGCRGSATHSLRLGSSFQAALRSAGNELRWEVGSFRTEGLSFYRSWLGRTPKPAPILALLWKVCKLR